MPRRAPITPGEMFASFNVSSLVARHEPSIVIVNILKKDTCPGCVSDLEGYLPASYFRKNNGLEYPRMHQRISKASSTESRFSPRSCYINHINVLRIILNLCFSSTLTAGTGNGKHSRTEDKH